MDKGRFANLGEKFSAEHKEVSECIAKLMDKLPKKATTEDYLTLKDILTLKLAVERMTETHLIMENMTLKMLLGEEETDGEEGRED